MRNELIMEIRARLKRYRKASQLNQRDFAIKSNLGTSTIKDLLTGPITEFNPSVRTLGRFLEACDRSFCDLFSFTCVEELAELREVLQAAKDNELIRIQYESLLAMIRHSHKPTKD